MYLSIYYIDICMIQHSEKWGEDEIDLKNKCMLFWSSDTDSFILTIYFNGCEN